MPRRLDSAEIPVIRKLYRNGLTTYEIARGFGVHHTTILGILTGRTWSHISDPQGPVAMRPVGAVGRRASRTRATEADVREIRQRHRLGETIGELSLSYGLGRNTVRCIVRRLTWSHID